MTQQTPDANQNLTPSGQEHREVAPNAKVRVTFNPVARILGLMLLATPLLVSVDVVSSAVAVAGTIAMALIIGPGLKRMLKRSLPLCIAAPLAGTSMLLYGAPEGKEYVSFGFAHITDNSISLALAVMVRVFALGLPAIVLLSNINATELGDGLAQILKLPERFVIGAVAAGRMLGLARRDWASMRRARRARGLGEENVVRKAFSLTFGLLVLTLRRGAKLSTAMEARGFGAHPNRTWARPSTLHLPDVVLMASCLCLSSASLAIAAWSGYLRLFGA
ncbi:energy-coupling factor transporter transmembrane component T family protein [Corynebacterium pseudopelargi]|uniref:Energy-coupling factor transporter transmembrane protein EcfT n=1 Tax=Corynebacterium pseudopelargi TaxID=2080757 RepID=A0A3G6IUX2_9CORY|nr:energy-coupling factor transporter transmembrane component T [Corynebacterium pseudopelargi]AZA09571.1 Energy-coupling factor transporter transmembrane protein EcfT [Corynebacterium pseudopelargi]